MRQIAGAFAEYEKARLVSKLRHARERVRQEKGKCEGRKPHGELRPEAVALAKRLHRASPKTGKRMSLRKIAAALAEAGHLNERGQPFNPKSIVAMRDASMSSDRCQSRLRALKITWQRLERESPACGVSFLCPLSRWIALVLTNGAAAQSKLAGLNLNKLIDGRDATDIKGE